MLRGGSVAAVAAYQITHHAAPPAFHRCTRRPSHSIAAPRAAAFWTPCRPPNISVWPLSCVLPPFISSLCSYQGGRSLDAFLKFIEEKVAADAGFARVDALVPLAQVGQPL